MFAALLLLQGSLLVAPLELGPTPPETRAIAAVRLTPDETDPHLDEHAIVEGWRTKAVAGGREFLTFAKTCAEKPSASATGVLGTLWKSMLASETGDFLFSAAIGEVNQFKPRLDHDSHPNSLIAVRLERDAACRQILVAGADDRARSAADGILRALRAGADFAALARERSDDRASALRGGDFAIFERGRNDALLREAAFGLKVGEISGVIPSPLGFHILQRVEVSALDPRLRDDVWARARGILIAFDGARGSDPTLKRDHDDAEHIANDLAVRIRRGDDMGALAKEFNEDGRGEHGGRARAGDLGWVRRGTTAMPQFMDRLFTDVPGTLIGPIATESGYVLARREDPGPRSRIDLRKSAFLEFENWVTSCIAPENSHYAAALTKAVLARKALSSALGAHKELLDQLVLRCANAADFVALCSSLPEHQSFADGSEVALRTLAVEYARSMVALEPQFLAEMWPQRERELGRALVTLRAQLAPLGDVALEQIMHDLAMEDPKRVVPVYLTSAASSDGYRARDNYGDGTIVRVADQNRAWVVDIADTSDLSLLQSVLRWTTSVLDIETSQQPTLLVQLRSRLESSIKGQAFASHALISAECAEVVRRVFDPNFVQVRAGIGWTNLVDVCRSGSNGTYIESSAECNQGVAVAIDAWSSFLVGKLTRAEALDAIVAAAKAAK